MTHYIYWIPVKGGHDHPQYRELRLDTLGHVSKISEASFHVDHNLDEQISPGSQNRSDFAPQKVDQKTWPKRKMVDAWKTMMVSFWGPETAYFEGRLLLNPWGGTSFPLHPRLRQC